MWDIHAHVLPPEILHAASHGRYNLALDGDYLVAGNARLLYRPLADVDGLTRYAAQHHLGVVLSLPPALVQGVMGTMPEWASFANDAMARLTQQLPVPSAALAQLTLMAPNEAMAEWTRVEAEFIGVTLGASAQGLSLDDDYLAPLWEGLSTSGDLLMLVHGGHRADERLSRYYLDNLVGYPTEDILAAATLTLAAMPIKYPGLHWCISHGGGGAAFLLGRWQHGYENRRPGMVRSHPAPREVFPQLWFDSVVHDRRALEFLSQVAPGQVVLGTDWPFPMGTHRYLQDGGWDDALVSNLAANGDRLISRVMKGRTIP